MLSRILYAPFVIALIVALYLTIEVDSGYSWYIIPPFLILAAIYFTSPEIDWWWWQRNVPPMDPGLEKLLRKMLPFYAALPEPDKKRFQNRLEMYVRANAFIAKGIKEDSTPPSEVVYFSSTNIVQLTLGQADYRLPKFERIVVYPAPFPSPQHPTPLHSSEIYAEDGVLIFAVEPLMEGIFRKEKFNIGFYEYARAYMVSYPDKDYAEADLSWQKLEEISGYTREVVEKSIGLPDIDIRAVAIHHFFYFPKPFKGVAPEVYNRYTKVFNLDLLREGSPIIDQSDLGDI